MKKISFILMSLFLCVVLQAQVKFANIFSDHMVLQRNAPVNIWGWAAKGDKVTVSFNKQKKSAVADKSGKWMVTFANQEAGGPYSILARSIMGRAELKDVLVGEVWLCSGQSNMEWPLSLTDNAKEDIASASNNKIRHVKIERAIGLMPADDILKTQWKIASPQTAGDFTAVGYYFAKRLQKELNVPVGIINSTWGGTIVETWISKTGLQSDPDFLNLANGLPETEAQFKNDQIQKLKNDISNFQKLVENEVVKDWEQVTYNDDFWSTLNVPQSWEQQGLPTFDGIIWYRTYFELTESQLKDDIVLSLGTIDDKDVTYVNGVKIGETDGWDKKRNYIIPKSLLKKGKNSIAVKVLDTGGGGGFYGQSNDVKLQIGESVYPLSGRWKARVDFNFSFNDINPNSIPTLLYNAMIHPVIHFSIKGINWYQGESNAGRSYQYNRSFSLLIKDWRNKFNNQALPFNFVQLAGYNANNENGTTGSRWAELRDAQLNTLQLKNTGMAVITDIGNKTDIHPRNKKDVGERLALIALHNSYNKAVEFSGPLYKSFSVDGNKIRIQFSHTGSGLVAAKNNEGLLTGFMIASNDQLFKWAKATIENNEVVVWNESIEEPVAVRFGWIDDTGNNNLFNKEGLPASPFRTDNWRLITQDIKYAIGQ